MSATVNATVFVDTSILLTTRDASEGEKQLRADEWMVHLWRSRTGRLSYQVLQEFYWAVTRRLDPGLSPEAAREEVRNLMAWQPLPVDGPVVQGAWALERRHGLAFWDATIVSAAQVAGCRFLLTDGLRHGLDFEGVEVINPFEYMPGASMIHEGVAQR
jgi:predicted nucleic acid-binding protein